jgi:hypothetical protein
LHDGKRTKGGVSQDSTLIDKYLKFGQIDESADLAKGVAC